MLSPDLSNVTPLKDAKLPMFEKMQFCKIHKGRPS